MDGHRRDEGFTLIELIVVVLIIAILITIAIPVFRHTTDSSKRAACFANQRMVEGAYASEETSMGAAASVVMYDWPSLMTQIIPDVLKAEPRCPDEGTYTWVQNRVTCSKHGHYN